MKFLILTAIAGMVAIATYAQQKDSVTTDSVKKEKKVSAEITFGNNKKREKKSGFSLGLTFARLDLGLSRYLDHGSFTLSPANNFLEYESIKTHNVGFELFQMGYRFNDRFKVYIAAGLDWTHIRLKRNITFQQDQPSLSYVTEIIDFKKNRFSTQYLRMPLAFQVRTASDRYKNRFYLVVGPEAGFLLNGKQKQVSKERGKVKVRDDFNFDPFRYGAFVRMGYADFGLYAKYYFNDVFAKNQGPANFKNMAFGFTLGF